jgi:hypothetical protein
VAGKTGAIRQYLGPIRHADTSPVVCQLISAT